MKNRSSNSRYRNLTFVAKFRGTVVTVSAIFFPFAFVVPRWSRPSTHACRAPSHEEFPQTHEPRYEEAQNRPEEIPGVVQLVMRPAVEKPAQLQRANSDVHRSVHRENHVGEPVHQVQERVPVEVRIVPRHLSCELLKCAQ